MPRADSCAALDLLTTLSPEDGDDGLSVMASLSCYWVLHRGGGGDRVLARGAGWPRQGVSVAGLYRYVGELLGVANRRTESLKRWKNEAEC